MKIFILLVSLLVFESANAEGIHLEIGAGTTYFGSTNGLWYQEGLQKTLNKQTPAFLIGVTGDIAPWLAWHADYVYLGSPSSNALATSDPNYTGNSSSPCKSGCQPLARFTGHGSLNGIALTLEPSYTFNKWRFSIEGGPFLFTNRWTEYVVWVDPIDARYTQTVNSNKDIHIGYKIGIGVSKGNLTLSYSLYKTPAIREDHPPLWHGEFQHVLMLKYKF